MAALVTKTIRITSAQENELRLAKYAGSSSFLFRELFEIFISSPTPGIDIIKLRKIVNESTTISQTENV